MILNVYISDEFLEVLKRVCRNVHNTEIINDMENLVENMLEQNLVATPEYREIKNSKKNKEVL